MSELHITNINVLSQELLPTPAEVKQKLLLSEQTEKLVLEGRETIKKILASKWWEKDIDQLHADSSEFYTFLSPLEK